MTAIRLATPDDRDHIVATIVAAFDQDPAFRAFFGDGPDFAALATEFAGALTDRRVAIDAAWVGADGDAVALWDPPAGPVPAAPVSMDLPAAVAARLADYDAQVHAAVPAVPHWYLGILASDPARRGEGLAGLAAEPGLAAARAAGVPAVLETTNPTNVAMYERRGWNVIAELHGVIGLDVWVMQAR